MSEHMRDAAGLKMYVERCCDVDDFVDVINDLRKTCNV
jgi:hypothetical protein